MGKQRKRHNRSKNTQHRNRAIVGIVGVVCILILSVFFIRNQSVTSSSVRVEDGSRPLWQTLPLINADTGDLFTLSDFGDRHVFVKIMSPT